MKLDNLASLITEEHELFLTALNGEYLAQTQRGEVSLLQVKELKTWAGKQAGALAARVSNDLLEMLPSLGLTVETREYATAEALVHGFVVDFSKVLTANRATAVEALMDGRNELGKSMKRSMGVGVGQLMLKKMQRLDFRVLDPANRKWDANRFVSFLTRELAYRLKLHVQVQGIVGDLAEVFSPDHEEDGMIFSITGASPGYPSLESINKSVFHPNSKAEIIQHAST